MVAPAPHAGLSLPDLSGIVSLPVAKSKKLLRQSQHVLNLEAVGNSNQDAVN
jgi:hypothetical protein